MIVLGSAPKTSVSQSTSFPPCSILSSSCFTPLPVLTSVIIFSLLTLAYHSSSFATSASSVGIPFSAPAHIVLTCTFSFSFTLIVGFFPSSFLCFSFFLFSSWTVSLLVSSFAWRSLLKQRSLSFSLLIQMSSALYFLICSVSSFVTTTAINISSSAALKSSCISVFTATAWSTGQQLYSPSSQPPLRQYHQLMSLIWTFLVSLWTALFSAVCINILQIISKQNRKVTFPSKCHPSLWATSLRKEKEITQG